MRPRDLQHVAGRPALESIGGGRLRPGRLLISVDADVVADPPPPLARLRDRERDPAREAGT